jgi:hypothetical protein
MSENVGVSTSRNPKGLHGLYRDNFTFYNINKNIPVTESEDFTDGGEVVSLTHRFPFNPRKIPGAHFS